MDIREALTFDDVLLVPGASNVLHWVTEVGILTDQNGTIIMVMAI